MPPRIKESKDPIKLIRSGIFALNRKKWAKAARKFELALKDEEIQQKAIIWANYGVALTNLKNYHDAHSAFLAAVQLEGKNGELWLKKGLIEYQLELYQDAEKSFNRAEKLDKSNDEIPILISRCFLKRDDLKKAIKTLESSLKKHPKSAKIPIELSKLLEGAGETEKSQMVLFKAIRETEHSDPGLLLGQLLLDNQQYDKAIEAYKKVLERFPDSTHAQFGVGIAHHAKKEFKQALQVYNKVITMYKPSKPPQNLYINTAKALKELGRPKEAIDALYKAKKFRKPSLDISLLFAELYLDSNRPDKAKRALEDAVLLDKKNPVFRFYLGMTNLHLENIDEAKRYFTQSIELDPSFHESKIQLSILAVKEKKLKYAYSLVNEVISKNPRHIGGVRLAAQIAFDLRDFRRTIELVEPLVENSPINIPDLEILLNSWLMLSQPERAHAFMNKLLSENKEIKSQLKTIAFFDQFLQ
ncbi:MAG: tetratricopeptide repeat protein [Candidatus Hodarchaeales archaeon]